jgi:N-6 DNA Methylase/TaqI-like C-terminal specificity domain
MNLFMSAGLDLPASSSSAGKRTRARLPRLPLFAKKSLERHIVTTAVPLTEFQTKTAAAYARMAASDAFSRRKETEVRPIFIDQVLGAILGYEKFSHDSEYSLATERQIRRGSVDVALGRFFPEGAGDVIVAPMEMKGADTSDLDAIMPGRGKSPVQQAWDYAIDVPGAKWVLVSNCKEIRLYGFGRGRDAYELFDLTRLDEPDELKRLLLLLSAKRFLGGETEALLRDSDNELKDITNALYDQYKKLRQDLLGFLMNEADGPKLGLAASIEVTQKFLDRILFVAFAGANRLMEAKLLKMAAENVNAFSPQPLWTNFQGLFRMVDKGGRAPRDIPAYNGGLFALDPVADGIILPDHLAEEMAALGQWDFASEVPVTVLGHLFEQSITDIEKLREGEAEAPAANKRKREGVVYTPDGITRFLVERTIGETLGEWQARILQKHAGIGAFPADKDAPSPFADDAAELAFWSEYLTALRGLTIVDPACGSGAFLVAAFDALSAEYLRVTDRMTALGHKLDFDIFDEILTKSLYGVDLNVESVEITRLSLWLKTARRQKQLQSLDQTIQAGNSIIHDKETDARAFDWATAFPEVMARGGFDIVIGNPPYVRMEFLKPVKPWLAKHYVVADERTDLYAYFFEKGVSILKTGGRLGFISSSTFFRTGSGEKLRLHLSERTDLEVVVDFGDTQVFEGVTTYPAILVATKRGSIHGAGAGDLRFLHVKDEAPVELGAAFEAGSRAMPRARLTGDSWQFEDAPLSALRDKIVKGRKTLGEVYGAPMRGIVTGLNEAFIIDTPTRERLTAADPRSAELLKPFLKGENVKRWRVEPEGLWLINTPKGKVKIDDYPAIRDWLLPFRDALEKRATEQEWFELQQAQLAYQARLADGKISYPHFQNQRMFALERTGTFSNDKTYFIPSDDSVLVGFLNSKAAWFVLTSLSPAVRNGWHEMRVQYVEQTPIPGFSSKQQKHISQLADLCTGAAEKKLDKRQAFLARLPDLGGANPKISQKLEHFHELDFAAFRDEVKRAFKAEIPVKERGQWEAFHGEASAEVKRLTAEIEHAEREIDAIVYEAFELAADEIALLEASIAGQA